MNVTLIRHATLLVETSHGRVLVDPMLRAAGTTPPIENTPNQRPIPLVDLPLPAEEVVAGVDLCIVTHLHGDHFDDAAADVLPRDLPILTQPESAEALAARGFTNIAVDHPSIPMTRGRHGTGEIGEAMGAVSGWGRRRPVHRRRHDLVRRGERRTRAASPTRDRPQRERRTL
ncbi:MAG TPA: MBL fold metallo-hydrolase, partial [Gaiellaceae bacterium]|nr:MBL fold metallo-hydrolase [Gaiellaceae bacterium]